MNEEQKNLERQHQQSEKVARKQQHHGMEKGIGAVGGSVAGAAVGGKLGGKTGAVVGAIAGAVVGGTVGEAAIEDLKELERKAMKALGEAPGENEILAHYSWEELQALSKPQT